VRKNFEEIFLFDDAGKYSGYSISLSLIHNKVLNYGKKMYRKRQEGNAWNC
jgi:hypothetical protein